MAWIDVVSEGIPIMVRSRMLFTWLLLVGIPLSPGLGVTAQTPETGNTTFQMPESGIVIDIGDSGEAEIISESYNASDFGAYTQEDLFIAHGENAIGVSVAHGDVTPELWDQDGFDLLGASYPGGAEILGRAGDEASSWFLLRGTYSPGMSEALYSDFQLSPDTDFHISVGVFGDEATLVSSIEWARANLTVRGEPVFAAANIDEIEAMLAGTSNVEPIPLAASSPPALVFEDKGLVSETEWVSPNYGVSVTWDEELWKFPMGDPYAIMFLNEDEYWLNLYTSFDDGQLQVLVASNVDDRTAADWELRWNEPEWLEGGGFAPDVPASLSDESTVGIILVIPGGFGGEELIMVRQGIVRNDGVFVMVSVIAETGNIGQVYSDAIEGLQIDGQAWQPSWTVEELEEIIGN